MQGRGPEQERKTRRPGRRRGPGLVMVRGMDRVKNGGCSGLTGPMLLSLADTGVPMNNVAVFGGIPPGAETPTA